MWIRKSDLEIRTLQTQKELEKKSLRRPFIFGAVFGLLFMIAQYLGFRGGYKGFYLFSPNSGFNGQTLYFGIFGFLLFFLLARHHQKKDSRFLMA